MNPVLPVELLQNIFSRVISKKDLSNTRLASLEFCAIVTPYVFRTIYVQDTNTSKTRLYSILISPHLAKEIKEAFIIQGEREGVFQVHPASRPTI
jgi:hypothetical protein